MADVNVRNYEELGTSSGRVLDIVDRLETLSNEYGQLKERLNGWESEHKESYISSLDKTNEKIKDMIKVARSYGDVGLQTSQAIADAESQVKALNDKFASYIN